MRPAKLVVYKSIAKHHNLNIMLYEPKKDRGKDEGFIWQLVYGKIQHKNDLTTINMGLLRGHCLNIKKMECFVSNESVKVVGRYLHET